MSVVISGGDVRCLMDGCLSVKFCCYVLYDCVGFILGLIVIRGIYVYLI